MFFLRIASVPQDGLPTRTGIEVLGGRHHARPLVLEPCHPHRHKSTVGRPSCLQMAVYDYDSDDLKMARQGRLEI